LNWGIIGTGNIAATMAKDFKYVDDAKVVAVSGTSPEKANKFAKEYGIEHPCRSLDELLADDQVDCVYIATPHTSHKDIAIQAMKAGKAVLCEKPMAINHKDQEEMIKVAKERHVFLMEAYWTAYLPAVREAFKWIKEGEIGRVRLIEADFSFRTEAESGRLLDPTLAGGALLDVGIYPVGVTHMISKLVGAGVIKTLYNTAQMTSTGVDGQDTILIQYDNGLTASLTCALKLDGHQHMYIYGEKGRIELPIFFSAKKASLYKANDHVDFNSNTGAKGYVYEVNAVNTLVKEGEIESPVISFEHSLEVIEILDRLRANIGLAYPGE